MKIKSTLAGALALLIPAVPSVALAQQSGFPSQPSWEEAPVAPTTPPESSLTTVNIVPPAYGSVFVYDGRRLLARLDGPGALWLPTGGFYRVVAMRGEQVIWNGSATTTGVPVELRWPVPRAFYPAPFPAPSPRMLTPPIEQGRVRTPLR